MSRFLNTKLTRALGIKHPIVQGGMHYVGYAEMAAAVSNAGGLGIITALTQPTPEKLRAEIRKCKALCPDKPFGVNLTLLPAMVPPNYQAYADVVVDEKIPVVETAGNNPEKFIKFFKSKGLIVIHKCVAVRHALTAQRHGCDFISVDGFECAGHPGEEDIPLFVLLALAARKLGIPYIASGGIADGKQLAAALALGAEGVNMGTRFMATTEAPIHENVKNALVEGSERDTTHVFRSMKFTERVFKNDSARKVQELEKKFPGDFSKIRHLVGGALYKEVFQTTGNLDRGVWSCGCCMGLIDSVVSCEQLLSEMVEEATDIIQGRLVNMVQTRSRL
jgi:NAD(P)H-dependent flavin oxidoreductase YrpB (nitropropane dioxygenase family)